MKTPWRKGEKQELDKEMIPPKNYITLLAPYGI